MRILIVARNRTVAVEGDRLVEPVGRFDMVLQFPQGDVRPGLINAHDHLHRNHYGRLGGPRYLNAYQWADDIQKRYRRHISKRHHRPRRDALIAGAWKNLFAGVTTVIHHDPWESDFDHEFPLRVPRVPNVDSLGMNPTLDGLDHSGPFSLHLAEGTDEIAAAELGSLAARGLLTAKLVAVHGVGMDPEDVQKFRAAGAALIWCPTSNHFLFGKTAPAALLREGTDVLLGSDSLLTGAGNLLDELKFAHGCGLLSPDRLQGAVGEVAARRFGLPPPSLQPGTAADLVVLTRPLLEASADDVVMVMVGGEPRVARPDLAPHLEKHSFRGEEMRVGPMVRWTRTIKRGARTDAI